MKCKVYSQTKKKKKKNKHQNHPDMFCYTDIVAKVARLLNILISKYIK